MDTIFALSSAAGQAGVAVIRISGGEVLSIARNVIHLQNPTSRRTYLRKVWKNETPIDEALVIYFQSPHSFTGEDCLEIQCHGSRAVLKEIMDVLAHQSHCRLAERGEFTRRAFYNQKMDLTAAEGLMELIKADTEVQRQQAFRCMQGDAQRLYDGWRDELLHILAYLEAFIDFPEEEIPEAELLKVTQKIMQLIEKIEKQLALSQQSRVLKDGFQIAIVGAPNVGKSSLLNDLAQKDVAIVSETAGTTRDIVEVFLDVKGYPVVLADTAGLRQTEEQIEQEGIRRALQRVQAADFILILGDARDYPKLDKESQKVADDYTNSLIVWNKVDLIKDSVPMGISVSCQIGLDVLWKHIERVVEENMGTNGADILLTNLRQQRALEETNQALKESLKQTQLELKTEEIRLATRALGKITGRVEIGELLDVIFSSFCIGK